MNLAELFMRISEIMKDRIPFVMIGGFAVNAYKFGRQTGDIDLMIVDTDFKKAQAAMATINYTPFEQTSSFARFRDNKSNQMGIDFIFVDQETMNTILKESKKITVAQAEFLVPSLKHLIALKLHALKNNFNHRVGKDLRDILELVAINKVDIKSDDFKNLCLRYGTPELYQKILSETP